MYTYHCKVVRVLDGDTLEVDVDLGFSIHQQMLIRLWGIAAPEKNTEEGKAAAAFLQAQLDLHPLWILETIKDRKEKYGRMLGILRQPGLSNYETTVNYSLLEAGHATKYLP